MTAYKCSEEFLEIPEIARLHLIQVNVIDHGPYDPRTGFRTRRVYNPDSKEEFRN